MLVLWMASGCDLADPDPGFVQPEIRLRFVEPVRLSEGGAEKTGRHIAPDVDYSVILRVRNSTNQDFSPDPIIVSDSESEVRLTLSLPPDDVYSFSVRFQASGRTVAEGAALYRLAQDTRVIDVPIIPLSPTTATVGFLPGNAVLRADGSSSVDLRMRLYGSGDAIAGLACKVDIEGLDPSLVVFSGAEIAIVEDEQLGLAWSWSEPLSSDADLGILSVPLSEAGTIRLRVTSGNLRSVTPDGQISPLQAVGARIEITP